MKRLGGGRLVIDLVGGSAGRRYRRRPQTRPIGDNAGGGAAERCAHFSSKSWYLGDGDVAFRFIGRPRSASSFIDGGR